MTVKGARRPNDIVAHFHNTAIQYGCHIVIVCRYELGLSQSFNSAQTKCAAVNKYIRDCNK